MALVVTIATVNRTSVLETDSIRISQVADSFTFTAELSLFDEDGDITITAGSHLVADEITIVDGATTYFGGYVVNQDIKAAEEDSRHLHLQCQGYGIRLNETLVAFEQYGVSADDAIIDDLFDTYLAAFDSVTHVAQIVDPLQIAFKEMTLAECMEAICARTKGRWYIDNSKKVHYFAAEENLVAWFLSDTPEAATSNRIINPSFEVDTAGWLMTAGNISRSEVYQYFGDAAAIIDPTGAGDGAYYVCTATTAASTQYTFSIYVYNLHNNTIRLILWDTDGGSQTEDFAVTAGAWTRLELTKTFSTGAVRRVYVLNMAAPNDFIIDGAQLEQKAAATSFCDGTRAGCTWSGTAHASTSDRIISYSYFNDPVKKVDAAAIVNRVRVIGADDFAVTRNDGTSQAAYGIRAGIVTDQSLETTAAMEERGDDVLDKNKDPRITYVVRTFRDGAVAGMDIGFRCPPLDIDTEQVIRELNITWFMGEPSYELTLGTHADTSAISRAFYTGSTIRSVIVSPNIPMGSRGWGHDIPFVATDYRTVKWVDGGTITLAGGVGSFAIAANAGNSTGNMAATTYIYFDADVSLTALQDDVDPANAIGVNKILIAVAGLVADEDTNKAIFQVFGGAGMGVLIVADNIAADTITGNEIAANAIVAGHIQAAAIETDKIKAGAVVADKLSIGQTIFSNADGLLILNPPIHIEKVGATNYWQSLRKQQATLSGALHLESGRWAGTKALVVEEATLNYCINPAMYDGNASGIADDWVVAEDCVGAPTMTVVSTPMKWMQRIQYTGVGGDAGQYIVFAAYTDTGTFAVGEHVTISAEYISASVGIRIRLVIQAYNGADALLGTWYGAELDISQSGPTRVTGTKTNLPAATSYVASGFYIDQIDNGDIVDVKFGRTNIEKKAYATTYCDGSLGDGYAWTDGAHASTSTRAATEVNLDAHVGLISGNNTVSFRVVVQMPYDADATWSCAGPYVFDLWGAGAGNNTYLYYNPGVKRFCYYTGAANIVSPVQTFKAGDWLDFVITLDYTNDVFKMYIAGVLADDDTTAAVAPTLAQWNLGSHWAALYQGGFVFAEYATFDRVLTVGEAAQLYNLQRPLIDTGATDKPGIYILDGMFRIQSSQTGVRIEITADQVAGYDGVGTRQFYLQASDGKAYAGGGAVILDEYGLTFDGTASMAWFTDDALNDFALGLIGADGFTISEYVGVNQKGLFRIRWDSGDIKLSLDYNDLADTVEFFSLAPLTITTGSPDDIIITPGSDRLLLETTYIELWELAADPAAPAADRAKLYTRENAGKTQLVVRFATGAIQVIATQP